MAPRRELPPVELVLGFPDDPRPAQRLAEQLQTPHAELRVHHFPDRESLVQLPAELPRHVLFLRSLDHPDRKLVELLLAARAARELGAERIGLVAPYLAYMRQDIAFHPGEAVSQRIVGRFLAELFDEVLTVDPHLHRVHRLEQAVPASWSVALSATAPMAAFLERSALSPLLLGPDEESQQWVAAIAARAGLEHAVAHKRRKGDRDVEVRLPEGDYAGRDVLLVDDVASTGCTLLAAARALGPHAPRSLRVLVTHALFVDDAQEELLQAGVQEIWSTDSVTHPTNCIELAPLLASVLGGPPLE